MFFLDEVVNGFTCGGAEVLKIIKFVSTLLDIIFFIVPMALIVIIIIDFAKNVIASKDDEMKKNFGIAIKRIMYCVALFLVEPIVTFAIDFIGENSNTYLTCLNIAESDEVWKYQIDWDYYPYVGVEEQEDFQTFKEGKNEYVMYDYTKKDGTTGQIKIYRDDYTKSDGSKANIKIYENGIVIKEK